MSAIVDMYMIWLGLFPCAPYDPTVIITTRTLEFFRHAHGRCPRLSIQAFVKSLCDVHGVPYKPYLCQQFTICYDLYLDVLRWTAEWVGMTLGRGARWCQENPCPACTYKLEGEPDLIFSMLWTMDGNESLRRVIRKEQASGEVDEETGEAVPGASKERKDKRDAGEGYFLDRSRVDEWAKKKVAIFPSGWSAEQALIMRQGEETPCADRWKNMVNDITSKMWGVFDETGIFPALCRHGFVLLLVDMIRSGELAKYPLALINELIDTYGKNQGGQYDIACHFEATIRNSKLSDRAKENALKMLVGAFHGHAHNRLCQLSFLANYIEGLGLEDLEGCERFFSKSNDLAKCVRYASRFHRQQEITQFIKHHNSFETYANLSKFLCNNYEQALDILRTEPALRQWMRKEGIESTDVFKEWLKEEKEWLLKKKEVTVEMQYVQKLINWSVSNREIRQAKAADDNYSPANNVKRRRALQHAKESVGQALGLVQDLEDRLNIDPNHRWTSTSPEWIAGIKRLKEKKFCDALDALELLIVEQIFELTKINQSQTGYKMRKHIAKALQTRSEAVKNAINRYNISAASLDPPVPQLTWEEVVDYAFLADFDFLRATDGELLDQPWTRPSYRLAMNSYFKILRAKEEIKRLNVEIRRVVTWICDEDEFLRGCEAQAQDKGTAALIRKHRMEQGQFDAGHMDRFVKLSKKRGFTGYIMAGTAKSRRHQDNMDVDEPVVVSDPEPDLEEDPVEEVVEEDEQDEDEDEGEKELAETVYHLARLAVDGRVEQIVDQGV
ncbi:hypothetical protein B0H16DRAFT_1830520 [Mycena metata]|uniref:CxC1-like cysteine cluster associated with KDZ transposases domain-containing protein n=1 Tax=Mycena metata TaxID=1033252 RepID=A0AAD7K9S2_9AGAR|nr:hypothetical protein B0H16DRAFT_1830520 [Mycena metata]